MAVADENRHSTASDAFNCLIVDHSLYRESPGRLGNHWQGGRATLSFLYNSHGASFEGKGLNPRTKHQQL